MLKVEGAKHFRLAEEYSATATKIEFGHTLRELNELMWSRAIRDCIYDDSPMPAYSNDLRRGIVDAIQQNEQSQPEP